MCPAGKDGATMAKRGGAPAGGEVLEEVVGGLYLGPSIVAVYRWLPRLEGIADSRKKMIKESRSIVAP